MPTGQLTPYENMEKKKKSLTVYKSSIEQDATQEDGPYIWDENIQGLIMSSFYWGYIATNFLSGQIAERFGAKHLLAAGGFLAGACSLVSPVGSSVSWKLLLAIRVILGAAQGSIFPGLQVLIASWIPPCERSRISTIIYSGQYVGLIFANMITGVITKKVNWEASFYLIGALGIAWVIMWEMLIYDSPEEHPRISQTERHYIRENLGPSKKEQKSPAIPYKAMLTCFPLWANIIAQGTYNWYNIVYTTYIQRFMSSILHYDVSQVGVYIGLAFMVTFIMSYVHGFVSDFVISRGYWSRTVQRKIVTSLCMEWGTSACLVVMAYAHSHSVILAFVFLAAFFTAGNSSGYLVNQIDLSPNFAGTIQGVANTFSTLMGIICPIVIGNILEDQTIDEWRIIFWITVGISVFGGAVFLVFASGEEQEWNRIKGEEDGENKKTYKGVG